MNEESSLPSQTTLENIYETPDCAVQCTIVASQQTNTIPCVHVASPGDVIEQTLFKTRILSTMFSITVAPIKGGGYVDYVNSISSCIIRHRLPITPIIGACSNGSYLICNPVSGEILKIYNEEIPRIHGAGCEEMQTTQGLRERCEGEFHRICQMNSAE